MGNVRRKRYGVDFKAKVALDRDRREKPMPAAHGSRARSNDPRRELLPAEVFTMPLQMENPSSKSLTAILNPGRELWAISQTRRCSIPA